MDVKGKKIFPLVTGTFGMTDFLHSVVGEMGDKVAQSEIEGLDSQLNKASQDDEQNDQTSVLKSILDRVPWDMLESDNKPDPSKADELKQAAAAKKEETAQHPLDPNASLGGVNIEEAKAQAQQTLKDMYPILEFHDQVMKGVTEVISKVPGLDELLENMTGALQIFVFSLLAPYVTPIIAQARVELKSTSEGVLKTSEKGQYEVFENDKSTDPTHSMLSKDHFSNVLNTIAGQIACATVKFVVPRIVDSWSDEGKDVRQTIDDILQVFHHPALRDENREGQKAMFETVKKWWEDKDESDKQHFKEILSFDGVKAGNNHEGESEEGGHSHGAPKKRKEEDSFVPSAQDGASALSSLAGGLSGLVLEKTGLDKKLGVDADALRQSGRNNNQTEQSSYGRNEQSSYGQSGQSEQQSSYGRNEQSSYGQSEQQSSYGRNEQSSYGRGDNNESSYGSGGNTYGSSGRSGREEQETSSYQTENRYGSSGRSGRNDNDESSYGRSENTYGSSGRSGRDDNEESSHSRREDTYGSSGRSGRGDTEETSYDSGNTNTYGSSGRSGRGDNEESSYGGRENTYGSSGRDQESSYQSENTYGQSGRSGRGGNETEESSYGRSENTYGSSRRDDNESSGYGGGRRGDNEESEYGQQREEGTGGYGGRRRGEYEENSGY
ncbi:hypothetical protein ONS96_009965 [Cadophora gregata f. sp. sojae]|nr:hypothetical protein ONS96_009965 [Cadophora gregata f. sp. sojae]